MRLVHKNLFSPLESSRPLIIWCVGLTVTCVLVGLAYALQRRRLAEVGRELDRSYKLALLTNGAPDLQQEKIAASGLGAFFDAIAVSGEHGIGKPRREIFDLLLAKLAVDPSEAAMVGNSMERDILGAKNAGLAAAIWLRVPGSEEQADVVPDYTITGLHEIAAILQKL